jgi:hypothetical protein
MATSTKRTKAKASTKAAAEPNADVKTAASESTKEDVGKTGTTGASPADDPKANPMSDPESHAVSPAEMAAMRPTAGAKTGVGAAFAASADAALDRQNDREAALKEQTDNSTFGRLSRSNLVLNENQITGERWVGVSIQQTDADLASKNRTRITPLAEVRPFRGLTVKPENGEPFALGDEFDRDATPADWLRVMIPGDNPSPLISA